MKKLCFETNALYCRVFVKMLQITLVCKITNQVGVFRIASSGDGNNEQAMQVICI
jgi:hypothetical protein